MRLAAALFLNLVLASTVSSQGDVLPPGQCGLYLAPS
eukprot:CAMPEP_0201704750 /NCGR_PEP_ID=MMETSP0578-20130828/43796_1 /ASSEMBLY_ACC=CAM_ASM_000663 /TAXON_ID=267565 /ORGANISM="Skeletonema grethea, Strain CCMP 1804" /LENGTH=36 /DNA_ID= /DNA_START= /DNA_END= /DNA_ORIENTATION=